MKEEKQQFLNLLGQLPARLTVEQVSWLIGCGEDDVPIIVAAKLLKPLGNPAPNAIKYYATVELLELTKDRNWLSRATLVISQYWKRRHAARISRESQSAASSPKQTTDSNQAK